MADSGGVVVELAAGGEIVPPADSLLSIEASPEPMIESNLSNSSDNAISEKDKRMLEERLKVMEELLTTESAYVNDLKKLQARYIEPICKDSEILPKEEQAVIFSNVRTILDLHETLLRDMRIAMAESAQEGSGQLTATFLKIVDFLRIYSVYCANRNYAISAAERCRKKYSKFDKLMSEGEAAGESLDSFLIKPVQRLCRYPLLFTVILQKTPHDHAEYGAIAKTLERLQQVANDVNEFSRKKDSANKIFSLSERLMGLEENLSAPGRLLEIDYETVDVSASFTADKREPMFVGLFSDIIMFAKPKKKKLLFKHKTLLSTLAWTEPPATASDEWPVILFDPANGFSIEITIFQSNKAEREHFVKALESLTKAERERVVSNPNPAPASPPLSSMPVPAASPSPTKQPSTFSKLLSRAKRGRSSSTSGSPPDSITSIPSAPNLHESSDSISYEDNFSTHSLSDLGISSRRRASIDEGSRPSLKRMNSLLIVPEESGVDSARDRRGAADWARSLSSSSKANLPRVPVQNASSTLRATRRKSLPSDMHLIPETAREALVDGEETSRAGGSGSSKKSKESDEGGYQSMLLDKLNPYLTGSSLKQSGSKSKLSNSTGGASTDEVPSNARHGSLTESTDNAEGVANNEEMQNKPIEVLQGEEIRRLRRELRKLREKLQTAENTIASMSDAFKCIESAMKSTKPLWNVQSASQ